MIKPALTLFLASAVCGAAGPQRSHTVKPHVTKRGTYVAPHVKTNPNKTQRDNYSAKGNVNPYTGKTGTKTPKK